MSFVTMDKKEADIFISGVKAAFENMKEKLWSVL